jgi:hypothetical protein
MLKSGLPDHTVMALLYVKFPLRVIVLDMNPVRET